VVCSFWGDKTGGDDTEYADILLGKPERKMPLGKHNQSLENNIKMDLKTTTIEWTQC
jgi:hypothetical protein